MDIKESHFKGVTMYCRNSLKSQGYLEAFPVNSENLNRESVKKWAPRSTPSEAIEVIEVDNIKGFIDPKFVEVEDRENGGRAYKVIISQGKNNFLVDMRETVVEDVMLNSSIEKGIFRGVFTFIQSNNHIKLIRVGSKEYISTKISDASNSERTKVTMSKLIPGNRYKLGTKSGAYTLYLGETYISSAVNQFNIGSINCEVEKTKLFVDFTHGECIKNSWSKGISYLIHSKVRNVYNVNDTEFSSDLTNDLIKSRCSELSKIHTGSRHFYLSNKEELVKFLKKYNCEGLRNKLVSYLIKDNHDDIIEDAKLWLSLYKSILKSTSIAE